MLIHLQIGLGLNFKQKIELVRYLKMLLFYFFKSSVQPNVVWTPYAYITFMGQAVLLNNIFHYFTLLEKWGK